MVKSGTLIAIAAIALTACTPRVVERPQGIGFDDPTQRALREAQLSTPRGTIIPQAQVTGTPAAAPVRTTATAQPAAPTSTPQTQTPEIPFEALAQAGIGQSEPTATAINSGSDPLRTQGLDASPSNPAPVLAGNAGLSDEQNFDAVSGRETIESDADRRAAQAAAREQVQPTAVPDRPTNVGPNIVEYALSAPNVKGQEWYSRSIFSTNSRFQRNCAGYATDDEAQRDFLARGGPDRDRRGIDPDGDGFACGWDPAPFIAAFRN